MGRIFTGKSSPPGDFSGGRAFLYRPNGTTAVKKDSEYTKSAIETNFLPCQIVSQLDKP